MSRWSGRLLGLVLLSFVGFVTPAPGFDGWCGGWGYAGFFNPWWGGNPYAAGRVPTPPYFALHPPVYYSQPVPRTYGYSPFAYPGWIRTPEVVEAPAEPVIIDNPHVDPVETPSTSSAPAGERPKDFAHSTASWIINPYLIESRAVHQVELAGPVAP